MWSNRITAGGRAARNVRSSDMTERFRLTADVRTPNRDAVRAQLEKLVANKDIEATERGLWFWRNSAERARRN